MGVEQRRAREREERRAAILAAATKVFAEAGIDGASMGAVAKAAELGKATLYYYFPTKEALHTAVLEEGAEAFFASLPPAPDDDDDLVVAIEAMLRGYLSFFKDSPELHRVLAPGLVHAMSAHWAGISPTPRAQPSAHAAWLRRLALLAERSPWRGRTRALAAFLSDVLIVLSQRILSGQTDLEAALSFYLGVFRAPPAEVRP